MRDLLVALLLIGSVGTTALQATPSLMETHCAKCHNAEKAKGKFKITDLGRQPDRKNLQRWLDALDLVTAREMPPEDESKLTTDEREQISAYLKEQLATYHTHTPSSLRTQPRRLNNREFTNSVRDVLMIEDIGTHLPTANLIGDSLFEGFDTHAETLGFSKFHLEQYIAAIRKIIDATLLDGPAPTIRRYEFNGEDIFSQHTSQNTKRPERQGKPEGFDFLDPRRSAYFKGFETVSTTGYYKIALRVTGKDRGKYSSELTGIYDDDPIRMTVRMGDRERVFELPDERVVTIELTEWLAAETRFRLHYPTDGLKNRGNGNFKFQNAITGIYLKEHQPALWQKVVDGIKPDRRGRIKQPAAWQNWVDYWMGARPRILGALIEGPYFNTWPPKRQSALLGPEPSIAKAGQILGPIAERAWRRPLRGNELNELIKLVQSKAKTQTLIEAFKEAIVTILISPAFLLHNLDELTTEQRFAAKFSTFIESTIPDTGLRQKVALGELDSFQGIKRELQQRLSKSPTASFFREFPFGWLRLSDINFMAPDPDQFRFYHRKNVSDDMIDEALTFFRYIIENNLPVTELISADYSFVNADLAQIYGLDGEWQDSALRKVHFKNGRRGGLLGMAAILTVTADSLATSPIHRATYIMENLLGIHPSPPPADVEINEPDVRQAKTIKEILKAHRSDPNCASCHESIDPYGYAFENFDPTGAWRDVYTVPDLAAAGPDGNQVAANKRKKQDFNIPIDASATFRNGSTYHDIIGYRAHLLSDANQDRFVRCFITKLLTYANGSRPEREAFGEIERILEISTSHDHRIIDTIAAVIDSPLFREE